MIDVRGHNGSGACQVTVGRLNEGKGVVDTTVCEFEQVRRYLGCGLFENGFSRIQ